MHARSHSASDEIEVGDARVRRRLLEGDETPHDLVDAGVGGRADEEAWLRSARLYHAVLEESGDDTEDLNGYGMRLLQ